ncbi:MAG: hypothetical protein AB1640_23250 [bacterium]
MGKLRTLGIIIGLLAILAGCGDDDDDEVFLVDILSDPGADGDIGLTLEGTYQVSQASSTGNLLFGIDPDGTEFRAFVDFPLGAVPLEAEILVADVEVYVNDVEYGFGFSAVPTLLEMVSFPITGLTPDDFDSAPIASRAPFDFFRSDINSYVLIEVTSLMREAQVQGLSDLQLRFLLDFVPGAAGFVELDDESESRAPLLTVEYR